jgi:H+/Cl- antiporter ClcA
MISFSSSTFWETMEYLGETIVILACVGEFFAEFLEIPKNRDQRHRFLRLCVIALIGGLAIGLLGLFKTTQISNREINGLKTLV